MQYKLFVRMKLLEKENEYIDEKQNNAVNACFFQSNAVTIQKVCMHADVDFTTYIESGVRLYVSTGECGTNLTMVVRML